MMLTAYFKTALRQLRIFKVYSLINVAGLSIGLASCFIIMLYVSYQTSFDKHNEKLDDMVLLTAEYPINKWTMPLSPAVSGAIIKSEIPEVKEFARWSSVLASYEYNGKELTGVRSVFADPAIFDILTMPLVFGNLKTIKSTKDFIVIDESLAKANFPGVNPIGKVLNAAASNGLSYNLTIAGVMKDIPPTSTFKANAIGPFHVVENWQRTAFRNMKEDPNYSWAFPSICTYLLLNPDASFKTVDTKLYNLSKKNVPEELNYYLKSFPVKEIYFNSDNFVNNRFPGGNLNNVYIYSFAALAILVMALVNYLMLAIGRASLRDKEICIRKVVGAGKPQLFLQITFEAVMINLLCIPIAMLLVQFTLPYITELLGRKIASEYFHSWHYILLFISLTIFVGILTGGYVAFLLARRNPVSIIKNTLKVGKGKIIFRRAMIVTQLIVSIGLIFGVLTIYKQLNFMQSESNGFNMNNLIEFYPEDWEFAKKASVLKSELLKHPAIKKVTAASTFPGGGKSVGTIPNFENPNKLVAVEGVAVDKEYTDVLNLNMIEGTDFISNKSVSRNPCILNETAVKELGIKNPVGRNLSVENGAYNYTIVGVVKDFHMSSMHEKIIPLLLYYSEDYLSGFLIQTDGENTASALKYASSKGIEFNNGKPFEYQFLSEKIESLYEKEGSFAVIITYAAIVAMCIACMGLFGMSIFVARQRIKEIGIRKVLGASTKNIFGIVTAEFILLALAAAAVSFPFAYLMMGSWLENFAYRTGIDLSIFLVSTLLGVFIVVITVSFQALKVSMTNPVHSLKYE